MVNKIPEFNDQEPMLNPQSVSSKAPGYDAFSQFLGNLAKETGNQAIKMQEQASASLMLESQGMVEDVMINAKVDMARNPAQAQQIATSAKETAEGIKSTAILNKDDRTKFNYYADRTVRQTMGEAAIQSARLENKTKNLTVLNSLPNRLNIFNNALYTDPKLAESLLKSETESMIGYVKSGVLTQSEVSTYLKKMDNLMEAGRYRHALYQKGDVTPEKIAEMKAYPLVSTLDNNADVPMEGNTTYKANSQLEYMDAKDRRNWVAEKGENPPVIMFKNIKSNQEAVAFSKYIDGAKKSQSLISIGASFDRLKHEVDRLNTIRKPSNEEEGQRDRLNYIVDGIEKRGMWRTFASQTSAGIAADKELTENIQAIQKTVYPLKSEFVEAQKMNDIQRAYQQYNDRYNAVGDGMDVPAQYRNVLTNELAQPAKDAFESGGNPASLLSSLSVLDKRQLWMLGNQMPNPRIAKTVYEVGMLQKTGLADPGFTNSFILSQQPGLDFKSLELNEKGEPRQEIKDKINVALSDLNNFYSRSPNASKLISASYDQAEKFVMYQALTHSDPKFKNLSTYIQTYKDNVSKAYNINSNFMSMVDLNVIPVQPHETTLLANYGASVVRDSLLEQGISEPEVDTILSRNPPFLVSSPDGRLTMIDSFGNAYANKHGKAAFDVQYNDNLLRLAERSPALFTSSSSKNSFMTQSSDMGYYGRSVDQSEEFPIYNPPVSNPVSQDIIDSIPSRGGNMNPGRNVDQIPERKQDDMDYRSVQTRGINNNNPGNIKKTDDKWEGEINGKDKVFKTFSTPEDGIRAMGKILKTYATKHKIDTIEDAIKRWSSTDQKEYIAYVSAKTGIDKTEKINLKNKATRAEIMNAIIEFENGRHNPYGEKEVERYA